MTEFKDLKKGDKVIVSRVITVAEVGASYVTSTDRRTYSASTGLNWEAELVERSYPYEWPVMPGDVWEANGKTFVAYSASKNTIVRESKSSLVYGIGIYNPSMDDFAKLNPVLKYRGDDDGQVS